MDNNLAQPLLIPRLGLSRQSSPQLDSDDNFSDIPLAGPSRTSINHLNNDLVDNIYHGAPDAQSTPKLSSIPPHLPQNASPADTPAARLRALLSRIPNNNSAPTAPSHPPPPTTSISEIDSDFDPLQSAPSSIARESLKDLFSRALRDPGDTPKKDRRRRNSIDVSEVEASPRVARERAKNKGKRRSMSDEEADKPSKSSQRSESSFRSSRAAVYDSMRERIINSAHSNNIVAPLSPREQDDSDVQDGSNDTATILRDLNSSQATPPAATSTPPQKSLHLLSQLPSQSNLLELDSEMQNAMKGLDSFDDESDPNTRPLSFPPPRPKQSTAHPRSTHTASNSHIRTHSSGDHTAGHTSRPPNGDSQVGTLSRASSSLSGTDFNQRHHDNHDHDHEREREWNRNHAKTLTRPPDTAHRHPDGPLSGARSPLHSVPNGLSRKGSTVSLRSDTSSRPSSQGSHGDYLDRVIDSEKERNLIREREWNKRHPKLTHHKSSSSLHAPPERSRSHSNPTHPDSHSHPHSPKPDHFLHQRTLSISSTGSESAKEAKKEVERLKERNWNAPRPQWNVQDGHHGRSLSPVPSPTHSSHHESHSHSHHRVHTTNHHATSRGASPPHASTKSSPTRSSANTKSSSSFASSKAGKDKSTSLHHTSDHVAARPGSPLFSANFENGGSSRKAAPISRFEWQFPHSRTPLPPLELDEPSPERHVHPPSGSHSRDMSSPTPSSRSASRMSGSLSISRIPVKSPKKSHEVVSRQSPSGHVNGHNENSKKGHRRTSMVLNDVEPFPQVANDDSVFGSDNEPLQRNSTPTNKNVEISRASPPALPASRASASHDQARLQKALSSQIITDKLSPPPSPSPSDTQDDQLPPLSTPRRRSSFTSSKVEFKSPSPPANLPELPGPPSSSEDENIAEQTRSSIRQNGDAKPDRTVINTPRPPGAWASTPARRNRANSLPSDIEDSQQKNSGLATPVGSLSRAGSLPLPTPAPPGGWTATPGRKSILKVRFDVEHPESEISMSEGGSEQSKYLPGGFMQSPHGSGVPEVATPIPVDPPARTKTPEPREPPSVQVTPRTFRKSPSIRLVDAFGSEQVSNNDDANTTAGNVSGKANGSMRSKSAVRIVDAMGRQVDETPPAAEESTHENSVLLDHNEAVTRVRRGLADLLNGLDERDSDNQHSDDHQHIAKLESESQEARLKRRQLSETLLTVRGAEDELNSKYRSLRASVKRSNLLPFVDAEGRRFLWARLNGWIFWGLVIFQIMLVLVMYRLSVIRARNLFLTTYYDPFYADLHLYTTKPDTTFYSTSATPPSSRAPWSIFAVIRRDGWTAIAADLWQEMTLAVSEWQREVWETWGVDEHGRQASWPPT